MASFSFSTYKNEGELSYENWENVLFAREEEVKLGSRLGVDYVRTQKEELTVHIHNNDSQSPKLISIKQFSSGDNGISGAVWDAGLLVVDYLSLHPPRMRPNSDQGTITNFLDLGCGTGVIGLSLCAIIEYVLTSNVEGKIDACVWFSDKENVREGLLSNMKSNKKQDESNEAFITTSSLHNPSKMRKGEKDLGKLLATMTPVLDTTCYYHFATISISKKLKITGAAATDPVYSRFLNTLVLSAGVAPLCTFMEKEGFTVIVSNGDSRKLLNLHGKYMEDIEGKVQVEVAAGVFARITLEVHSSLDAVGLTAAVSTALTNANISANIVAGYFHDHIFVQESKALEALAELSRLSEGAANKISAPVSAPRRSKCEMQFISHDWQAADEGTSSIFQQPYSVVTCGDILYDASLHPSLISLLEKLRFETLLIGYKKRHADKEKAFFTALAAFCDLRVIVGAEREKYKDKDAQSNLYRIGGSKATGEVGKTLFVIEAKRK